MLNYQIEVASLRITFYFIQLLVVCLILKVLAWFLIFSTTELFVSWTTTVPAGVLLEKLGGVRLAFQNPYPIYDRNLRYSLPYLWPDQKFETLFMTWNLTPTFKTMLNYHKHNLWRAFVDFLFDTDEKVASQIRIIPISKLEYKTHTLFITKMAKIS